MVSIKRSKTGISSKDIIELDDWLESLKAGWTSEEIAVIARACTLSQAAHAGQQRASGEPYFQHSLAVANILVELRLDQETIVAALLHDVVENSAVTLQDISQQFGAKVAQLVDGVTKMQAIQTFQAGSDYATRREAQQKESLRKMLLAMVEDIRVVFIKLADRAHNMRTLSALSEEKQTAIARETLEVYAPLANRLGIWQLKWELEDLAFKFLESSIYKKIASYLNERREDRERYIARIISILDAELKKHHVTAEVYGRPKHIYSIWRKMQQKNLDYQQLYDIRAVRILVPEIRDCYTALGIVHSLWQYIPGEFDDYIATPKENNYQSIHTAVVGPDGKTVEVQIRTHEMHQQSELGVAAHWRYKEGAGHDALFMSKIALMRQLLEWKDDIARTSGTLEHIKLDIFKDRVYVFTPKGNIIDLPQGATVLDFAYHIHTDLGHRCRGAKVNGQMVPLTYGLNSGDQVEILAIKQGGPSRDWLNPHLGYLKTSRARDKAQHWFRLQNHEQNAATGRDLLEKELQRLGIQGANYEMLAKQFGYHQPDDLFAALGRNDIKISQILHAFADVIYVKKPEPKPIVARRRRITPPSEVEIYGIGNLLTQIAQCCRPLPGDDIVGYITRGKGVSIHRSDCSNMQHYLEMESDRLIRVTWGQNAEATYPVNIMIVAYDRQGLLRDITAVLANENIDLIAANTLSRKADHSAVIRLTVEVRNIEELSKILIKIQQVANVIDVKREE